MNTYERYKEHYKKIREKFKDINDGWYEIKEIYPNSEENFICECNVHECNCGNCKLEIPCDEPATYVHMENHYPFNVCNDCKMIKENGC